MWGERIGGGDVPKGGGPRPCLGGPYMWGIGGPRIIIMPRGGPFIGPFIMGGKGGRRGGPSGLGGKGTQKGGVSRGKGLLGSHCLGLVLRASSFGDLLV